MQNLRVVLASRPQGPAAVENFRLESAPMPVPREGEALVRNLWLSLDPYMRGRMSDAKSYVAGVGLGEVMVGQTVGEVLESRDPGLRPGDKVVTSLGWQLHGVDRAAALERIEPEGVPLSYYLGVLGMPGYTAYFGLKDVGQPKPGETVVVSAASGAVGSIVGQLAKIWGCRVVGIAGGKAKCDYVVNELGFDACVDYKAGNLYRDLKAACPDGVDVNFENVAGIVLDTLLRLMNRNSRIVLCGLVSDYSATEPYGYKMMRSVLINRITLRGIIVFDWHARYGEALHALSGYLKEGRIRYRESVLDGLDEAPRGLVELLAGGNFGKQLVRLA